MGTEAALLEFHISKFVESFSKIVNQCLALKRKETRF
jgi:hypothetical protein